MPAAANAATKVNFHSRDTLHHTRKIPLGKC